MKKQIISEEFRRMQKLAGLITESQLNENDLKLYHDILMDVGGEDLAGEYKDIESKSKKYNSFGDFVKADLSTSIPTGPTTFSAIKKLCTSSISSFDVAIVS